jgi:alkylation response protein AidB-like acyl-CoA dehydrogenase
MEWFENEELVLVTDTMRTFCAQEIEGKVVDLERLGKPEFPREAIDKLSDLGFLWGPAPEDIGSGMDRITTVVLLSELARSCAGFAAIVAAHYAAVNAVLAISGGLEIAERLCASGRAPLLGIGLEDGTRLRGPGGSGYVAIPAPDKVDLTLFFSDGTVFLSPASKAGAAATRTNLSGCDEMPAARLTLTDAAPEGSDLIASGPDAIVARDVMTSSLKLYFSAVMQGAARSATAYALDYAKERRQTGRAIIYHQNVYKKLVEMEIKNQSMASFLYRAACNGGGDGIPGLEDMLFAFTKATSEHVVNEAVQTLGGYGYMREYGLEKKLRDIKTLQALLPTPDSFPVTFSREFIPG